MIELPAGLVAQPAPDPTWVPWLERLPHLAQELVDAWDLAPDGAAMHGRCSLALPVRTADGRRAVLKVGWPHEDAEHEALALQHWHGSGAVELLRADPRRWALLLERLGPAALTSLPVEDACAVVAGLYGRLHRPAVPRLRTLSRAVARWAERLTALPRDAPVPRRLVERAAGLGRDLSGDAATDGALVHTDLHDGNVLAGTREAWLAIDPKPLSGDPHYEPAPLLWNRWDEAVGTGDVRRALRRRLDVVVEHAGLDYDRARDWVVVRAACNALWVVEELEATGRAAGPGDRDALTTAVAMAKAVED
ncbi:aminoglycoside phosphotransferase family protein [Cellulomonas sp. APG4]|uniref:aminoglycoside phosphotransferase family protein n=1 Tax=Cellulomonas sp. APG4 TaxID=1538656 RepID=UPI00192A2481